MKVNPPQRAGILKVHTLDKSIVDWYDDLQADYRKFFSIIFSWCPSYGYTTLDAQNKPKFHEPDELLQNLTATAGPHLDKLLAFGKVLEEGGKPASSAYALFYEDYTSSGIAKCTKGKIEFLAKFIHSDDRQKYVKKFKMEAITNPQWDVIAQEVIGKDEKQLKTYWQEKLAKKLAVPERKLGAEIRTQYLKTNCKRPTDRNYCCVLMTIIARQLKSQTEKAKLHRDELEKIKKEVDGYNHLLLPTIIAYAAELEANNSGLSKYVVSKAPDQILNPPAKQSDIHIQVQILNQPKYNALFTAPYKERIAAYNQWKIKSRYEKRLQKRKYILFPSLTGDYKIPISADGNMGNFLIEKEKSGILVKINGGSLKTKKTKKTKKGSEIHCCHSGYFSKLILTPKYYKKKDKEENSNKLMGYEIEFQNRLTNKLGRPEFSPWHSGVVKEIGLQRKNNTFFITIPFSMEKVYPALLHNEKIARFFSTAAPSQKDADALPEILMVGFDLNLSMPLPVTLGRVGRNVVGEVDVDMVGQAKILENIHLLHDNNRCKALSQYKRLCLKLVHIIREFKACKAKGITLSPDSFLWLEKNSLRWKPHREPRLESNEALKDHYSIVRTRIHKIVAKFRKKINKYNWQYWYKGQANVSELIRLIDAEDAYKSLISSFQRIHLGKNQSLPAKQLFNSSRANKKKYLLRRIAATLANYCRHKGVGVVLGEDLSFTQDSDNPGKDNSLTRLFSANSIMNAVELALNKYGIAFRNSTDPNGTSKTDPLTGDIGFRPKFKKRQLFVKRNGEYGWIDSDLAGSLNVFIRGVNRSIVPYKFFIDNDSEKERKRLNQFLTQVFGSSKVFFYEDPKQPGIVLGYTKALDAVQPLNKQYLYYRQGVFLTQAKHRELEDAMKALCPKDAGQIEIITGKLLNFQAPA